MYIHKLRGNFHTYYVDSHVCPSACFGRYKGSKEQMSNKFRKNRTYSYFAQFSLFLEGFYYPVLLLHCGLFKHGNFQALTCKNHFTRFLDKKKGWSNRAPKIFHGWSNNLVNLNTSLTRYDVQVLRVLDYAISFNFPLV